MISLSFIPYEWKIFKIPLLLGRYRLKISIWFSDLFKNFVTNKNQS